MVRVDRHTGAVHHDPDHVDPRRAERRREADEDPLLAVVDADERIVAGEDGLHLDEDPTPRAIDDQQIGFTLGSPDVGRRHPVTPSPIGPSDEPFTERSERPAVVRP
jgi:hypothetical protein